MSVQVVTDSTCDIPAELISRFGITVLPLQVAYTERTVEDGPDFDFAELYARLAQGEQPIILAPGIDAIEQAYTRLDRSLPVLAIHLSGKLSQMCGNAQEARTKLTKVYRIHVVDTQTTGYALGMIVLAAAKQAAAGEPLEHIVRNIATLQDQVHLMMAAESSEFIDPDLLTTGPSQPLRTQQHQMQFLRPMVRLENGVFQIQERVRTRSKGLERLYEYVEIFPYIEQMAIITTGNADDVEALLKRIEPLYKRDHIAIARCNPLLATQVGAGMVGIVVNEGIEN